MKAWACILWIVFALVAYPAWATEHPNIVIILTYDQGYADASARLEALLRYVMEG